jgi:hypothetical protein
MVDGEANPAVDDEANPAESQDAEAPLLANCPALDEPCETICWTLFVFTSEELEKSLTSGDQDATRGDGVMGVGECVQHALSGCFAEQEDAGAGRTRRSISDVIEDCTAG